MTRSHPRTAPLAAAAASVLLLAACGTGQTGQPTATGQDAGQTGSPRTGPTAAASCPDDVDFDGPVDDRGAQPASGGTITLEAGDFYFDPTCALTAEPGTEVQVTVDNVGQTLHNIQVDSQDIDQDVAAGESQTVTLTVPDDGTVNFVCKYHVSAGMVGAVTTDQ